MELFTRNDFKIFAIAGFRERMANIALKIRPKLTSIGDDLEPMLSSLVDTPLFVHVAKHARRTVNPPDDTWAAVSSSPRGYKKDVHFKIAVSRHCVRFLFEAGPEYYAKLDWARQWTNHFHEFAPLLRSSRDLAWFENEHDEEPAASLKDLDLVDLKKLGGELARRRDGQVAIGRRIDAAEFCGLGPRQVEKIAFETFKPLAQLFALHDARVLAAR